MPPSIAPELKERVGAWGHPTSTLDWCEENYVTTVFIAELWNTLSNVWFMVLAALGVWYCRKYHVEQRYVLCYIFLFVVGVGSTLFHGSLKLSMQLLDELPMLILSAFMVFTLQEMGEPRGKYTSWTYIRTFVVVAYTATACLVYVIINNPIFHEVAYALMVLAITILGFRALGKYGQWAGLRLAVISFSTYLFAFFLWSIDNYFCTSLRSLRITHLSLLAPVTQFHAWWHFLAALGTYLHLVVSSKLRMEYLGHTCRLKRSGPALLDDNH